MLFVQKENGMFPDTIAEEKTSDAYMKKKLPTLQRYIIFFLQTRCCLLKKIDTFLSGFLSFDFF